MNSYRLALNESKIIVYGQNAREVVECPKHALLFVFGVYRQREPDRVGYEPYDSGYKTLDRFGSSYQYRTYHGSSKCYILKVHRVSVYTSLILEKICLYF